MHVCTCDRHINREISVSLLVWFDTPEWAVRLSVCMLVSSHDVNKVLFYPKVCFKKGELYRKKLAPFWPK